MAIITPSVLNTRSPMPNAEVTRPSVYSKSIEVGGLAAPKQNDILRLTPQLSDFTGKRFAIDRLSLNIPAGVAQDNTTQIVIADESDGSVLMHVATAADANAWDAKSLEFEDAASGTAGDQLLYRTFDKRWFIGVRYPTAKAAAIAANKKINVFVSYRAAH